MSEISPPKIVIRTPNWLGDHVMASGFVKAVLDYYHESEVDLIVKSGFENLPLPRRGKVIVFDPEKISAGSFEKNLASANYSHFYVLPPSFPSAWMAFQSKIPQRIGYAGEFRSLLLSKAKKHEGKPRSVHILKEYLNLLDPQLSVEKFPPQFDTSESWIEKHLKSFQKPLPESYLVLTPGAVYGPAKQWPLEHFRSLAAQMIQLFGTSILILGTDEDAASGAEISQGIEGVHNYCGQTTLTEFLAILAKANLLIGNDSGSMHLMGALQRPQIALFGSTSPTWTAPVNPHASVLSRNLSCSPCFARTCRYGHYDCLTKIQPELVLQEAQKILSTKN
ncbi:lipopolysaccharide heptosyltransferase II [Deltaproteobacteria bacterium]|nr:lipopolysaccharide heptosyltransferase II [Deltaproteobacteria bacterium]